MFVERFNRLKFNQHKNPLNLRFGRDCVENINSVVGGKTFKYIARHLNEKITAKTTLHSMLKRKREMVENFSKHLILRKHLLIRHSLNEKLNKSIYASKNTFMKKENLEWINGFVHVGKHMKMAKIVKDIFGKSVIVSKNMFKKYDYTEIFSCETNATSTVYNSFTLNLALPPWGEVRINSDNFTALMGLTNVLHTYQGDWINLDRDAVQIIVSSGNGVYIYGELLYNERYI